MEMSSSSEDNLEDIQNVCNNIVKEIEAKIAENENQISNLLDTKFNDFEINIKDELDKLTRKFCPPLIVLDYTDEYNYLINLIFQCLFNIEDLTKYLLNPSHKQKIIEKYNNGNYFSLGYCELLENLLNGKNKLISSSQLYSFLLSFFKNKKSFNLGIILHQIFFILHEELRALKQINNIPEPSWNYDKKAVLKSFGNYFGSQRSKISELFFSMVEICKQPMNSPNLYLFMFASIITLNLENLNFEEIHLEKHFKQLYFDYKDKNKYCPNGESFVKKSLGSVSKILVFNVKRNNNNMKKKLIHPKILDSAYIIEGGYLEPTKYELISLITTKIVGNSEKYVAYCRSWINKKWYLYEEKNISLVKSENEVFDDKNASLLIYSQI
jgi:ubiquitin C-terminal hydrolase